MSVTWDILKFLVLGCIKIGMTRIALHARRRPRSTGCSRASAQRLRDGRAGTKYRTRDGLGLFGPGVMRSAGSQAQAGVLLLGLPRLPPEPLGRPSRPGHESLARRILDESTMASRARRRRAARRPRRRIFRACTDSAVSSQALNDWTRGTSGNYTALRLGGLDHDANLLRSAV